MIAKLNPELADWRVEQLRNRLFNSRKDDPIHASEVDGNCLLKAYYRRTEEHLPPLGKDQILRFMRGWGIEYYIAPRSEKLEPKEKDGIICSVDDLTDFGISEIKSTAMNLRDFDPVKSTPQWISRGGIYCNIFDEDHFNLEVFFVRGNYKDIREEYRCWTIYFDPDDLLNIWATAQRKKALLSACVATLSPIPMNEIQPLEFKKGKTECSYCELSPMCYYFQGKEKGYKNRLIFQEKQNE